MSLIKKIRIKNFKSLEDVEIEIKPLTFLFGPNSSGKSTFLKALMFLSKNLFPLNTEKTIYKINEDVNLGSFKDIVTNNDISKTITFEIEFEGSYLFPKEELLMLQRFDPTDLKKLDLFDNSYRYLRIDDLLRNLNSSSFFNVVEEIVEDIDDNNQGIKINSEKLFADNKLQCTLSLDFKINEEGHDLSKITLTDKTSDSVFDIKFEYVKDESFGMFVSNFKENNLLLGDKTITELFSKYFTNSFNGGFQYPIEFPNINEFLYILDEYIYDSEIDSFINISNPLNIIISKISYEQWDKYEKTEKLRIYYKLLKLIYISYRLIPNNLFRFFIYKHLSLTRIIPKPKFIIEDKKFADDEYYGILNKILEEQNEILNAEVVNVDQIDGKEFIAKIKARLNQLYNQIEKNRLKKNIYLMSNFYLSKFFGLEYCIKYNDEVGRILIFSKNFSTVNFSTSSSGLIQLFPIIIFSSMLANNYSNMLKTLKYSSIDIEIHDLVVRYNYSYSNLDQQFFNEYFSQLLIEQPELHLHAKLQSKLAELFSESIKDVKGDSSIIIETHSEHLIRKIQVLIAKGELDKEKVGVWYFDNIGDSTKIRKMEIEENGFFKEPWPDGFFDDSANLSWELLTANKN